MGFQRFAPLSQIVMVEVFGEFLRNGVWLNAKWAYMIHCEGSPMSFVELKSMPNQAIGASEGIDLRTWEKVLEYDPQVVNRVKGVKAPARKASKDSKANVSPK